MRIKLPSFKEMALETKIFEILAPKTYEGQVSCISDDFSRNYARNSTVKVISVPLLV